MTARALLLSGTILIATLAGAAAPAGAGRPVLETTITAGPAEVVGTGDVSFAFTANGAKGKFECSLNAVPFAPCISPQGYSGLADGLHHFSVRAVRGGHADPTPAEWDFTVATAAPSLVITSPEAGAVVGPMVTVTYTTDATSVDCSIDGETVLCAAGQFTLALPHGLHTAVVTATDGLGNTTSAAVDFVVDAQGPVVMISSPAEGAVVGQSGTITFEAFDASEVVSFDCSIDGTAFPCGPSFAYAGLAPGVHTFEVTGHDALGNAGPPASVSFTVE